MLRLLDKVVLIISIAAIAGLLGAYTAPYVNPNTFVVPSLMGLAYPYLLVSNIILLLYWITRWKRMALISLAIVLLGYPFFMTYYGVNQLTPTKAPYDISVLSYNIRYFDMYGWSKSKNTKEKLFDYLNSFKGDVCCLQEFPTKKSTTIKPQDVVERLSTYPHKHIYKDMAIFSRLPIINTGEIVFDKKYISSCIYADVLVGKKAIRIYNIHLESYRLGNKERKFVKNISENMNTDELTSGVKNITGRVMNANRNRAKQAEIIKAHIQKSPHNVIVCGDFNDTPLSYTYRKISEGLKDSFIDKGRGLGNTYIGEFPSFRIDFILHNPGLETVSYSRGGIALSDHYPIMSKLKLSKHP